VGGRQVQQAIHLQTQGQDGDQETCYGDQCRVACCLSFPLNCGHAHTRVCLKWFSHWMDNKCWWCAGTAARTRKHLFRHGIQWRDLQKALWIAVGKVMGWKAGRYRHVQVSELFSLEECDEAVMNFLVATEVGKLPPKSLDVWSRRRCCLRCGEWRQSVYISLCLNCFCPSFSFHLSVAMKGGGGGGALPSSRLARRWWGYWVLSYSCNSAYCINKLQQ